MAEALVVDNVEAQEQRGKTAVIQGERGLAVRGSSQRRCDMLGLRPGFVYLTVVAMIVVLAILALSSGSAAAQPPPPEAPEPTFLPPGAPAYPAAPISEVLGEEVLPAEQQPAAVALPSTGTGGFQSAGGALMPTLLLAIAGGGFLAVGALAGLATTRCRN